MLIVPIVLASVAGAAEPDLDIEACLKAYYTSNLYRVTEEREDQFDSRDDPGERFYGMEGPEDFVTRPGVDLSWEWDVAKKRDFEISFGADYYIHARNTIADYLRLKADLAYDVTRDDELGVGLKFLPDRFKKNLSLEEPGTGDKIFERADYRQISIAPWYSHDWSKDWSTGIEYEYSDRNYESPFENRDRERHGVTAMVQYEGLKRVDITLGVGYRITDVPEPDCCNPESCSSSLPTR